MTKVQEYRNVETQVKGLLEELELKERIESTVKAQLKELSNFYRISESLVLGSDISTTLDEICESISNVPDVDGAWIGLIGEEGDRVIPVASRKVPEGLLKPTAVGEGATPVTEAIKLGKPTIIDNCGMPRRFNKWCGKALGSGFASALVLPLIYRDTVTGVLAVLSCQESYFVPQLLPLFQMYANQTSAAVRAAQQEENVQLYQKKASFHEKQYRLFLEQLSDAVFILNAELDCTYCNRTFERYAGKDIEKVVGRKVTPFFNKDDAGTAKSALTRCLEGADTSFPSRTADGVTGLEVRLHAMRAEDGAVVGVLGIARDVSSIERAEELEGSVHELNGRIEEQGWIIDDSPTGTLMVNPEGRILHANPTAAVLLNSTVRECTDRALYDLFSQEHRSVLASALATALHSGSSELEASVGDGEDGKAVMIRCRRRRRVEDYVVVMYLSDIDEYAVTRDNYTRASERLSQRGKELERTLVRLRMTQHELQGSESRAADLSIEARSLKETLAETEEALDRTRKELEKNQDQLNRTEETLSAVERQARDFAAEMGSLKDGVGQSGGALIVVDAGSGKVARANDSATKLFGYSANEFSSLTLKDLIKPENGDGDFEGRILNGTYCPFECSVLRVKAGQLFTGSVTSSPYHTSDTGLISVQVKDTSAEQRIRDQFGFVMGQLGLIDEMFKDEKYYIDVDEHVSDLVQKITPRFHSLGYQCMRISLDDRTYCIEEDTPAGAGFSSDIIVQDMASGTLHVTLSESIAAGEEERVLPDVLLRCVDLIADAIGWLIERTRIRKSLAKNHEQLITLKKIFRQQDDMNDPLQAVQASASLLLERSGSLDSTDRSRLNVIDEQAGEVRRIIKRIGSLAKSLKGRQDADHDREVEEATV